MHTATATATGREVTARDAVLAAYGWSRFPNEATAGANAALWAGHEVLESSREAWAAIREAGVDTARPAGETPVPALEMAARHNANRVAKAADALYGVASSVACGLWVVMDDGRVGVVEGTTSGSEYLDAVRFVGGSGYATRDVLVSEVVAFVEFEAQAAQVAEALNL